MKSRKRFEDLHHSLRKNWVCMLPDRRLAFQDGLPAFGLYLGDFETEAREKVLEDLKRSHATN